MKTFASDNFSPVADEIMQALHACNHQHVAAYGGDDYTKQATQLIKKEFIRELTLLFVYNGTAANTLALKSATRSHQSIITVDSAHIATHEVGAPMAVTGAKLVTIPHHEGKLTAKALLEQLHIEKSAGAHNNKPRTVSISQTTEFGSVYTLDELEAIARVCHDHQLILHMDGCRLYNAAITLSATLAEITQHVDVLSLGGTKNGLMFGEAVIFFNPALSEQSEYMQKQLLQLHSKMRYISAQFIPFFKDRLWYRYAEHANKMCAYLADQLCQFESVTFMLPPVSNQIFARLPKDVIPVLQKSFPFYQLDPKDNLIRLVTSFDTSKKEIDDFMKCLSNSSA